MLLGALRGWLSSVLVVLLMAAGVHAQAARPAARGDKSNSARGEEAASPRGDINEKDDKEARDLFKLGKQAFDEGRFERALKYFNDAYELSHRAALLSNIGTVLDRLRRDREALDAYRSYLAQVPDAPNRGQIEERVRIIEGALQKTPPDQQSAVAASDAPAVPTPAQTAEAQVAHEQAEQAAGAPTRSEPASSGSIASRWWFWAGIGGVAVAAVVVGVAASSGGGIANESPALLGSATRVREL